MFPRNHRLCFLARWNHNTQVEYAVFHETLALHVSYRSRTFCLTLS